MTNTQQNVPEKLSRENLLYGVLAIVNALVMLPAWISLPIIGMASSIVSAVSTSMFGSSYSLAYQYSCVGAAGAMLDLASMLSDLGYSIGEIEGYSMLMALILTVAAVWIGIFIWFVVSAVRSFMRKSVGFAVFAVEIGFSAFVVFALMGANAGISAEIYDLYSISLTYIEPTGWAWLALFVAIVSVVLAVLAKKGTLWPVAGAATTAVAGRVSAKGSAPNPTQPPMQVPTSIPQGATYFPAQPVAPFSDGKSAKVGEGEIKCPGCSQTIPSSSAFCPNCGVGIVAVERPKTVVSSCGQTVSTEYPFCPHCGEPLAGLIALEEERLRAQLFAQSYPPVVEASSIPAAAAPVTSTPPGMVPPLPAEAPIAPTKPLTQEGADQAEQPDQLARDEAEIPPAISEVRRCPSCGIKVPDEALFCGSCGSPIEP